MKIIALVLFIIVLSSCALIKSSKVYDIAEEFPEFRYDTCTNTPNSCERYFRKNFKMPPIYEDNGYQGMIIFDFVVEKDGSVTHVKLLRGMGDGLDKCVYTAVKTMPKWIPGKVKGKVVRSHSVIPVPIRWLYGVEK